MSTDLPPVNPNPNSVTVPRRRNGKLPSCEPCRKAKMRCDHTLPVCQNCRRRSLVDRCIYVDGPLTRPKTQRTGPTLSSPNGLDPAQINAYAEIARLNVTSPEISTLREEGAEDEASIFRASAGFFGPTSFSAVFRDNDHLSPKIESPQEQSNIPPSLLSAENDRTEEHNSAQLSLGVRVLTSFPNQATCDRLMELYASKGLDKAFHKPTAIYCMASLWSIFGQALRHPRKSTDLREMAQLFSRNTWSVLRDTDDPDLWLAQLSGRNIRWEMIGILIANLGFVLLALPEDDQFWSTQSGRRMHRREFALEMKELADDCVKLCNQMDNINMLMISLLFKRCILESQCTGDTSLMLWRCQGDLNNAATGLGLHRDRDASQVPDISTEMRRRIWAVVFSIDKTIAAFTGRPPGLSHRYNICPLPLDLNDEVLLASREERIRAKDLLDSNGWSTTGEINPATSTRAVAVQASILGEILEIALGTDAQYSHERLTDLKFRSDQAFQSWPKILQYGDKGPASNVLQWNRFSLRLRHLQCSLLLEQLAVKRAQADQQPMIDVAREILELTVYMWIDRDRFLERHFDYDWMIMCYGVPASGVICLELMKQMRNPRERHLKLPRSEVIQNLSMLVGFLEWVTPTAANRDLCGRMSVVIKRLLDQILDPSPNVAASSSVQSQDASQQMSLPEYDFSQMDTGGYEDWLGAVDWTQGPFVDLGNDELGGFSHFP